MSQENEAGSKRPSPPIPTIEWLVAAVGCCLVLGTFGILGWSAVQDGVGVAVVSVRVDSTRVQGRQSHVSFTVHNAGGGAATQVTVEGKGGAAGNGSQTLTIDFLPPHSSQHGVLLLEAGEPGGTPVSVRVVSYRE